jgi:hypothetical protein
MPQINLHLELISEVDLSIFCKQNHRIRYLTSDDSVTSMCKEHIFVVK